MNKNRVYNTKKNSKLASINLSRSNSKGIGKPFIIALITIVSLILISLVLLYQEEIVGKAFEVVRVNSAGVPKNLPPVSNLAQINIPVRANIGNARTTAIRFVMSIKRSNGNLIQCSDTDAPTLVNSLPWGQASSAATPHDAGMAANAANPLDTSISRIVCSGTQWTFEYATLNFGQAQPLTVGQPIDIAQFQFLAGLAPGAYTFSASEFTIVDNRNPPVVISQPAPVLIIPVGIPEDTIVTIYGACGAPGAACTLAGGVAGSCNADGTSCVAGAPPVCQAGQIRCGNVCVNLQTDRTNCGSCRTACLVGQSCNGGICRPSCDPSFRCRDPAHICENYVCKPCSPGFVPDATGFSCVAAAPPSCAPVGTTNSQTDLCRGAAIPTRSGTARVVVASCPASPLACTYLCNTGLVPNADGTSCVARGAVTFGINPTSSTGQTVSTGQTINVDVHMDISGTGLVSRVGFTLTAAGDAALEGASAVKGAVVIDPTQTLRCINKDNNPKQVACQISGPSGTTSSGVIVKIPGKIGSLATGSITFELSSLSATDNRGTDLTAANGGTRTLTVALPACPAGQTRCGNVCVNLQTDNSNCGACGNACTVAGQTCQGTPPSCQLAPPAPSCVSVVPANSQNIPCPRAAAPTVSNTRRVLVANCPASPAACTYPCNTGLVPNADGTSCVSCASVVPANSQTGLCPGAAIPAAANTARVLVPSCPVDPLPNSVAACTYPCNRGFVPNADRTSCVAGGACGAVGAVCTRPCFTGSTCDATGANCQGGTLQPAGTACTLAGGVAGSCNAAGACIVTCLAGQILCDAQCVSLQTDARNCGVCGTACPVGQSCRGGLCALASCGNGQLDINEECDLSVVSTAGRFTINSCAGVNNRFTGGTLGCRANCLYDTSICTSPPPPPPASSGGGGGGGGGGGHCVAEWQCTPWSYCNKELKQTRTCTDVDPRCSNRPKIETRDCPACEVSWTCGLYSQCINGQETRSCWDEHECGTAASRTPSPMPQLSKSCVIPVEPSSGGFLPPPPVFQPPVVQKLSPFQKYKVPIIVGGGAAAVGLPALFYLLFKRRKKKVYNLDELKEWIRKERVIGTSNNDIIQILKEQTGWNHKEIMGAFESLRQESLESESSPVREVGRDSE